MSLHGQYVQFLDRVVNGLVHSYCTQANFLCQIEGNKYRDLVRYMDHHVGNGKGRSITIVEHMIASILDMGQNHLQIDFVKTNFP